MSSHPETIASGPDIPTHASEHTPSSADLALGNDNERIIVVNIWSYWAHLSIYRFALPYCTNARVLDAGTGLGYGAHYLARNASSVIAYDASTESVAYANDRYSSSTLSFAVANLNMPLPEKPRSFDLVFSSNVFEHVADVDNLASECARVVKEDGIVIIAVPPITTAWVAEDDVRNVHHVHHLPPAAWHAKLMRFFSNIECHGHRGIGRWGDHAVQKNEMALWTDKVTIRETDFEFPPVGIEGLNGWQCITALFVCRGPRDVALPESLSERMPASWHEGAIAAKILGEERQEKLSLSRDNILLQERIASLEAEVHVFRRSMSGVLLSKARLLAKPIRTLGKTLRSRLRRVRSRN